MSPIQAPKLSCAHRCFCVALIACILRVATPLAAAELLDRGVCAFQTKDGHVYVGWRLLKSDPPEVVFDVLRSDTADSVASKVNVASVNKSTDFIDVHPAAPSSYYRVRARVGDRNLTTSRPVRVDAGAGIGGVRTLKLAGDYAAHRAGVADLNGDGALDYVVVQPDFNVDPGLKNWRRSPEPYKIEAYRQDGTLLWRHDLGWGIETGTWYSPVIAFDLDGDGRAEVYTKTAPPGDPRDELGYVTEGPEFLTQIDGETGKVLRQVDWPDRSGIAPANPRVRLPGQAPNGYVQWSRNQIAVAYLDGKSPSLIVVRGTYSLIKIRAYNAQLRELWSVETKGDYQAFAGQGAHGIQVVDIDADGRDELVIGAAAFDDDGKPMWTTGRGHPDVSYVADIDPERPGLEVFFGYERKQDKHGLSLVDARTGEHLWGYNRPTTHIHGEGMVADIDPSRRGMECYGGESDGSRFWLYDAKGNLISDRSLGGLEPRALWWTARSHKLIFHGDRLFEFNGPEFGRVERGKILGIADVIGDWREELILGYPGEVRIYSTTVPATSRRVCLLQDRQYRGDVAEQMMGYFYPPILGAEFRD
jgi:rhamnogalacturonan endolyase